MLKGLGPNFTVNYEKNLDVNYVVISDNNLNSYDRDKAEVVKNTLLNLLPISIIESENQIYFKYDITEKIRLSQYFKEKNIGKKEFLSIMSDITNILKKCNINRLDAKSIIIDEDAIYIDKVTKRIYMMYVPFDLEVDNISNLKSFLVNTIMFSVAFKDSGNEEFIQKFIQLIKSSNFSIFSLDELISELKEADDKVSNNFSEINNATLMGDISSRSYEFDNIVSGNFTNKPFIKESIFKNKVLMNYILLEALIVIGFIIIVFALLFIQMNLAFKVVCVVFTAISVYTSWWMWRDYFKGKVDNNIVVNLVSDSTYSKRDEMLKKLDKKDEKTNDDLTSIDETLYSDDTMFLDKYNFKNMYSDKNTKKDSEKSIFKDFKPNRISRIFTKEQQDLDDNKKDEKISDFSKSKQNMIKNTSNSPVIFFMESGINHMVTVEKDEFLIGRLKGKVDLVTNNSAIGRMHAKIVKVKKSYYLIDLQSRNGTFLNGKRIESEKEHLLKNNDEIVLANTHFKFTIPDKL